MIVLDVNVILDVASTCGPPFSWDAFNVQASSSNSHPSVRALATLRTGHLPDGMPIEIWTSEHIDRLVALKASQPTDAVDERDRGLGWSVEDAQQLIDVLITDIVVKTGGGSIGDVPISYGTPPLSHEDGCVYATANRAGHVDVFYDERYCLTRDGHFLHAKLPGPIDVLHPNQWLTKHQALARAVGFKRMLGR